MWSTSLLLLLGASTTQTAVAFANGQGGCLVFGVEDQTLHAIYDDRLEITSLGRLPMGQTIERMKPGLFENPQRGIGLCL